MLIFLHISVALLSLAQATFAALLPSRFKLRATYGLVSATLISGVYLVWSLQAPLFQACTSGLTYLAIVSLVTVVARHRVLN
jgi:hypothetical protein